jgi:hypothetical protein
MKKCIFLFTLIAGMVIGVDVSATTSVVSKNESSVFGPTVTVTGGRYYAQDMFKLLNAVPLPYSTVKTFTSSNTKFVTVYATVDSVYANLESAIGADIFFTVIGAVCQAPDYLNKNNFGFGSAYSFERVDGTNHARGGQFTFIGTFLAPGADTLDELLQRAGTTAAIYRVKD